MAVWLVTGGNGFVGRHVLEALASEDSSGENEIVVLGRRPPTNAPHHAFIEADLADPEGLRATLQAAWRRIL